MSYPIPSTLLKADKDDAYPFPWTTSSNVQTVDGASNPTPETGKRKIDHCHTTAVNHKGPTLWTRRLSDYMDRYPNMKDLHKRIDDLYPEQIVFHLPHVDALSGNVLRHSIAILEDLIAAESPVMFKVGFTHNPVWRWDNAIYGYSTSRERWSKMVVVHISPERHGPAMLEAALIEKFQSALHEPKQ